MGVYLLLAVSGLALTASFLHTGDADHGPALTDRLDKLEQALEKETELRIKLRAEFESEKEMWRNEKLHWEKEKHELTQTVTDLKEKFKTQNSAPIKTTERDHVTQQSNTDEADSSNSVDIKSRADDTGGWEPVVGQISQQLNHLTADVQTMKNVNTQQDQAIQESRASVFVRWGRSVCPNSDSLVYSGAAGGSLYRDTGAGSNLLCLSMSPVFSSHPLPPDYGVLYGAEYQTWDTHLEDNAPCAVCRSQHPTNIMVPGTNQCPSGWTLEYGGYLMVGSHGNAAASEYVCVDTELEGRPGGGASEDGTQLFLTVARCDGSLPCPPYGNNKIVTCAVCSK